MGGVYVIGEACVRCICVWGYAFVLMRCICVFGGS